MNIPCQGSPPSPPPFRFSTLLVLLFGLCNLSYATAESDHGVARSVVKIRGVDEQGRLFYGSGVVVAPESVATSCHSLRQVATLRVSATGEALPATRLRASEWRDLCLIEVPGLKRPAAQLGQLRSLKVGDRLRYYGYPRALGLTFSEGEVRALHPFEESQVIETTAFFTLGGSGGGLFDDHNNLVGLATFLAPGHSGSYFVVPADWIGPVQEISPQKIGPVTGQAFWERPGVFR